MPEKIGKCLLLQGGGCRAPGRMGRRRRRMCLARGDREEPPHPQKMEHLTKVFPFHHPASADLHSLPSLPPLPAGPVDIIRILVIKSSQEEKWERYSPMTGLQEGKRNNWLETAQLLPKDRGPDGFSGKNMNSVNFILRWWDSKF